MSTVNKKMTAIADEIRYKTNLNDELSLEQMKIDIASIPSTKGEVPSYVQEEAERVTEIVRNLQNENTISFIAISDIHATSSYQNSIIHASQAINIIKGLIPIDFTTVLGDIVSGSANDTLETHLNNHMAALRTLAIADPQLRLCGNHDANIYNSDSYMTSEELYKYTGRFNTVVTKPDSEIDRGYFYYDIENKKVRVICLNSADLKDIPASTPQDGGHISANQLQWFIDTLDMTEKDDWKIIILSHHPIHWYGMMVNILTLLDDYVTGSSGSVTADDISIDYNFEGKNSAKLIGSFHGHTHNFIYGKAGTSEIVRMGTPNACYSRNNEYGSTSYSESFREKYGDTTTYSKTENTAKDTAFCIYTIDLNEEIIYSTCYGAGFDRILSYGDIPYYTITNNLGSATSNNSATFIKEGESYNAEITLDIDGYSLGTVTVTMNGEDITETVYSDGIITIESVTGDIVITATAIGYTNLIPLSINSDGTEFIGDNGEDGYKLNYRISTSTGEETSAEGISVTGFIPLPSDTTKIIRVKNIDLTSANSTYAYYDDSFNTLGGAYCNDKFDEEDENGVRSFTTTTSASYIRISGIFGYNPIITINEEITETERVITYTNVVPTSIDSDGNVFNDTGYKEGYRLNSSGTETSASNAICSGFIPFTSGDIVRVYGSTNSTSGHTANYIVIYDSSFNKLGAYQVSASGGTYEILYGLYLWTIDTSNLVKTNSFYFRTSMASCTGENFVVTINEEID